MSRKGGETQRDAHWFALTRWVNACLLASASSLRLCAFARHPIVEFRFISPNLNKATRSAHVRVVLENPGRRLKNKSFAEGTIELDAPEVLAIPRSAVLWPGGTPRVFVRRAPDTYELREVKLDRSGDAPPSVAGTFQSRRCHRSAMIQSHNLNTRPPHTSCLSSSPLIFSARATLP
jgi:hypothetical protein